MKRILLLLLLSGTCAYAQDLGRSPTPPPVPTPAYAGYFVVSATTLDDLRLHVRQMENVYYEPIGGMYATIDPVTGIFTYYQTLVVRAGFNRPENGITN